MCLDLKQCKQCAHLSLLNHDYRCSKYHNSLCTKVYDFCQGTYFLHQEKGMSLYKIKHWINHLSSEELELPLVVIIDNNSYIPLIAVRTYNDLYHDHWCFYMGEK